MLSYLDDVIFVVFPMSYHAASLIGCKPSSVGANACAHVFTKERYFFIWMRSRIILGNGEQNIPKATGGQMVVFSERL